MAQASRQRRLAATPDMAMLVWLAVVALLSVATLVVFNEIRRFNVDATPWPFDRQFAGLASGSSSGWEIEGDPALVSIERGTLRLRNDDPTQSVGVRQVWQLAPDGARAFRVAATLSAAGVEGPGLGEVSLVADGDIGRGSLSAIHQLAALRGTREAARYVSRFEFPSATRQVELAIRLRHATGEITMRALEVVSLKERRLVRFGRLGLQGAWALALAIGCWLFARGIDRRRSAALLAAVGGAGLVLLLLPQTWRNAVIDPLTALLPGHLVRGEQLADLGHLAIFAVVGLLVRFSRCREPAWLQLLLLIGFAGLAELLQFLTELRSPTLSDWLTNAIGAVAGWVPAQLWILRQDGQFETQRSSSTTEPPQAEKQRR